MLPSTLPRHCPEASHLQQHRIRYTVHTMPRPTSFTRDILEAALTGLEERRRQLDSQIESVRQMLGRHGGRVIAIAANTAPAPKSRISAAGRARIAAAQRKRWAAKKGTTGARAAKKQGAKTAASKAPRKRRLSAAGRKAISEAARKRWAAVRAAKEAAQ
jgi:hypothetical protein